MGTGTTHAGDGRGESDGHGPGHSHGHAHDEIDFSQMAGFLEREGELHTPFAEEAMAWLRGLLLEGGCGPDVAQRLLDVGSGPGVHTSLLAHAFPQAEVVAVDGAAALLERARARAEREGTGSRVTTLEAQLPDDIGRLGSADVLWISHVVHHVGDQQAALDAFAGLVRPGGLLAVVERGLPPRFLPRDIGMGRPGLLSRLDVLEQEWFSAMREALPGHTRTVEDWPAMLGRAGLTPAGTRSFLTDVPAPLDHGTRRHLHEQLGRKREQFEERLADDDRAVLEALLDEEAPTGILHRPDAFFLSATTVHTGRAA